MVGPLEVISTLATVAKQPIYCYSAASCQVMLSLETFHTILANQNSNTDFLSRNLDKQV